VQKLYGKLPRKASLFYIKKDKFVPYEIDPERIEQFKETIAEKIDLIFDEKFDAKPDFYTCKKCDYAEICDAKEVQQ
jgi:CRISPR/Cas system-associated exonuclease Cas4 (RecB family)